MRVLRRYGYRVVAAWFVVALVASVGLDLGVGVKPAGADAEWYDSIVDGCKAIPAAALGTATGTVAFVGGPSVSGVGGTAAGAGAGVGGGVASTGTAMAAGGVTLSASTVAASAVVAVGGFCGTTIGLDWLFNEENTLAEAPEWVDPDGVVTLADLSPRSCSAFGITPLTGTNACMLVFQPEMTFNGSAVSAWPYTVSDGSVSLNVSAPSDPTPRSPVLAPPNGDGFVPYGRPAGSWTYVSPVNYPTFPALTGTPRKSAARTFVQQIPCAIGTVLDCGLSVDAFWYVVQSSSSTCWTGKCQDMNWFPWSPWVRARGYPRRLTSTVECWGGLGDWSVRSKTETSQVYFDYEQAPADFEVPKCKAGEIPKSMVVKRIVPSHPENPGDTVLSWTHPNAAAPAAAPAATMQCWVVGVTSCPIYEVGDGSVRVGGPTGTLVTTTPGVTSRTLVADGLASAPSPTENPWPWPSEAPDPDPDPAPTTTAPTTTTTTSEDGCEAGAPGCPNPSPPSEPDGPDGSGGECWPSGWGWFNPAEWVLRPIKCALVWAFWDQESADEIAALGDEHGWTALITESSVTTSTAAGPCVDMDYADICTEPILSVELPSAATVLLTAAVLFFGLFEVIGLFARITGGS